MLLTRVLTAAVLIAAFLAAILLLDGLPFKLLVGVIVAVGAHEWSRLSEPRAPWGSVVYAVMAFIVYMTVVRLPESIPWIMAIATVFWIFVTPFWLARNFHYDLRVGAREIRRGAGFVVLVPAGVAMASLSPTALLVLIGLSVVADTAAYFCGRAFGRHKLAPTISPGKTWEGAIGGGLACLIYATICAMLIPEIGSRVQAVGWALFLCAIMVLCAVSILGDLFESALKRRAGAKDSGRLLPGHGGVLDRIDSATATLPVGYFLLQWSGVR